MTTLIAFYQSLFERNWSPYTAALVIVAASSLLFAMGSNWGVFGGLKLWGNSLNQLIGYTTSDTLPSIFQHRLSLLNICFLAGALCAALLARQFRWVIPAKRELLWGALGGSLMGVGATLAGGCTAGGFFTPISVYAASGWVMGLGLIIGTGLGLKIIVFWLDHIPGGGLHQQPPKNHPLARSPVFGLILLVAMAAWVFGWLLSDEESLYSRVAYILIGFILGLVLQRSRFCLARMFREFYQYGNGNMSKSVILALALGMPINSLLIHFYGIDPYHIMPASFWLGALAGGIIFGAGMTLAGGCATSSLWRAAEGSSKHWVTIACFAWIGALSSYWGKDSGLINPVMETDLLLHSSVGQQNYLPDSSGHWMTALVISTALLALWYFYIHHKTRKTN